MVSLKNYQSTNAPYSFVYHSKDAKWAHEKPQFHKVVTFSTLKIKRRSNKTFALPEGRVITPHSDPAVCHHFKTVTYYVIKMGMARSIVCVQYLTFIFLHEKNYL